MEVNLRAVVLDILTEIEKEGEFSHITINNALSKYQYLDRAQRAFINRLALGTIECRIELDYIINQFSKTPVNKMKPVIRRIMRMAVYQLIYMENIPDSAACNEAVKLAAKRGFTGLKGFVNGVLRNISRNKENIVYPDMVQEPQKYLSVKSILAGMKKDKKTYIRCNTLKGGVKHIKDVLEKEGVTVNAVPDIPYAYEISGYDHLTALESFNEGLYQIQDISSMAAGEYVLPSIDSLIVDVCAAPGGKSVNAALKAVESAYANIKDIPDDGVEENIIKSITGRVISRDVSDYKVSLIDDNIERLGISNIDVQVYNALDKDDSLVGKADIVIADLPCSGLGIMGRKPDIRYNISPEKISDIIRLQRDILEVVSMYVKPGGTLVYSTCTINRSENEDNADWICTSLGFTRDGEYVQMLPSPDKDNDGFFVARLIKNS
uniref:transcription antitermination factor NusB n=1 Tax=Lachnospira sp. TaxID=2049031 RepID=UPI004025A253